MERCPTTRTDTHPAALRYAVDVRDNTLSRREFLTRTTSLGLSAAGAYALIGMSAPAHAASHMIQGGEVRIEGFVRALGDPRSFSSPTMSNFTRGWLENLVEYNRDGSFRGILLQGWSVNEDATEYTLNVRPGVTWNDGTPFTADDVAFNIERWCDRTVENNSMASRMATLIDGATGKASGGAIEVVDGLTIRLRPKTPDVTLIAGFADFPAGIVPRDFGGDVLAMPKGTGPYLPDAYEVGVKAVLVKNTNHNWWGKGVIGEAALDRIEFLDFGSERTAIAAAVEADEIDMLTDSPGDFVPLLDSLGWESSEAITADTLVTRTNQTAEIDGKRPYADVRVRRALAMAVDNSICLELGYAGRGLVAGNDHVCQLHPEFAQLDPPVHDPQAAMALMREAGMAEFEFEILSIDDDWQKDTSDVIAAQLRDAGFNVRRKVLPTSNFWNGWNRFPFSSTHWLQRPLGVQVLALAYRSGEPWNETGFSNAEFDSTLAEAMAIADADTRRSVMKRLQTIMREEGVIIQPFWRSIYRHHKPGLLGAEMHPSYEVHVYKLGWESS